MATEFKIGTTVKFGLRNKHATGRGSLSILYYHGVVTNIDAKYITVEYKFRDNSDTTQFRQMRKGNWVCVAEKSDDPKGRLDLVSYSN